MPTNAGRVPREEAHHLPETPSRPAAPPADWPTFHLAHPGPGFAMPGDPNCAFFWNGMYHLHYIYRGGDGYAFAHVSSSDMVRWEWHPTTLTPSITGHGMWSGTGFITKEGHPAIIYHGAGPGNHHGYGPWMNQVAIALDEDLESWSQPRTVQATVGLDQDGSVISNWDPDAWLEDDVYFAIFGGHPGSGKPPVLLRSEDLEKWEYVGLLLDHDMPDVAPDEDVSCPNLFSIGDTHMLLCISHSRGCRYYLGQWTGEKFIPEFHGRMNWSRGDLHTSEDLNFFAPESVLTPDGRRVMWAWCRCPLLGQTGVQSLPRELALGADGILQIRPLRELESLRWNERAYCSVQLIGGESWIIPDVFGDALELYVEVPPGAEGQFGAHIYADPSTGIGHPVCIDTATSTISIGDIHAPFHLEGDEPCRLRVFVDKNIIEVFVNDRQAIAGVHPDAAGPGCLSLFSRASIFRVDTVQVWSVGSIYD